MTVRYTLAGAALLLGVVMIVTGIVATPHITTASCSQEGTASQGEPSEQTTTPNCTTTTQPARGQQLYLIGLGFVSTVLGAGVILGDDVFDRVGTSQPE